MESLLNDAVSRLIDTRWDTYLNEAGWLSNEASHGIKTKTGPVKNEMLLPMWYEFLAFQEGIARDVYDIEPCKMVEEMGSIALMQGFISYLQGALDVAEEVNK